MTLSGGALLKVAFLRSAICSGGFHAVQQGQVEAIAKFQDKPEARPKLFAFMRLTVLRSMPILAARAVAEMPCFTRSLRRNTTMACSRGVEPRGGFQQGVAAAQYRLGLIFYDGADVPADQAEAANGSVTRAKGTRSGGGNARTRDPLPRRNALSNLCNKPHNLLHLAALPLFTSIATKSP